MIIRATIATATPRRSALWFQTLLAVDRGVPSELLADGRAWLVLADDGQAVRFVTEAAA